MNLQVRKIDMPRPGTRRRQQQRKSGIFKFYVMIYFLVAGCVLFGALSYQVDLNRKITKLRQETSRAKREIKDMERDIQSCKIAKARLSSWENISRRIAEYKLPLRPAEPGQVRYMTVNASGQVRQISKHDNDRSRQNDISLSHAVR